MANWSGSEQNRLGLDHSLAAWAVLGYTGNIAANAFRGRPTLRFLPIFRFRRPVFPCIAVVYAFLALAALPVPQSQAAQEAFSLAILAPRGSCEAGELKPV